MTDAWAAALRGRRVLVLGATGFIGRHLTRQLLAQGAETWTTGRSRWAGSSAGDHHLPADLQAEGSAAALVHRVGPDVVFNLAAHGVSPAERDPAAAHRLNAGLVQELVDALPARTVPWPGPTLVHVGSALEYGEAGGHLDETGPARPTTLYGRTKLAGTEVVRAAVAAGRCQAVVARLFTVYGPGERAGRLLPTLLEATRHSEPVPLTAGTQRRDFTFVDEVVEGLIRLATARASVPPVVNLATGVLTPVREFVERAARVLGLAPARLVFGALEERPEEMRHDPVSTHRLRGALGWAPSITIEEGVARTRRLPGGPSGVQPTR